MSNIYFRFIYLLILSLFFVACKNKDELLSSDDNNSVKEKELYVPGEVIVGFVDTVNYKFCVNFFDSLKLEIKDLQLGHNFWAKADSNDLEYYKNIFSNDSSVVFINELYSDSNDDTLAITITFTGINTIEYDFEMVQSVGLNVYKINNTPKSALLKTNIGEEKYYITKLISYDFITYATLNHILHTN